MQMHTDQSIETISDEFNRQLDLTYDIDDDDHPSKLLQDAELRVDDKHRENEEEHDDDDDDDDFTFMFLGGDESTVDEGEKLFPLFDRNLLLDGEYEVEEIDRLPVQPPVEKIFIPSPSHPFPSEKEHEDETAGPYCVWSKESATATAGLIISKKSNSTGFSKLWRLKDKGGRSNSYGRDAFVFSKSSDKKTTTTTTGSSSSSSSPPANNVDGTLKVKVSGGKARVVKGKKSTVVSAHEAYLKSRGGHTEEERRRSYLPYRPELMGFFTNVHGGLTKNLHPY